MKFKGTKKSKGSRRIQAENSANYYMIARTESQKSKFFSFLIKQNRQEEDLTRKMKKRV